MGRSVTLLLSAHLRLYTHVVQREFAWAALAVRSAFAAAPVLDLCGLGIASFQSSKQRMIPVLCSTFPLVALVEYHRFGLGTRNSELKSWPTSTVLHCSPQEPAPAAASRIAVYLPISLSILAVTALAQSLM